MINNYIAQLSAIFQRGNATEHTYRADLKLLIETLYPDIIATNEPARIQCGAPDYIITRKNIPLGYIEAKDIDKNLNDKIYQEQFNRYKKSLNNLIITNYTDFHFFKNGELIKTVKIAEIHNNKILPLKENFDIFKQYLNSFISYNGQSLKTPSKLAKMMADKAKLLAEVIKNALESKDDNYNNKTLQDQFDVFKNILISNITVAEFSDVYAQTIAYGMFAGKLHDTSPDTFSRQEAWDNIPKSNPFLRKLFGYIAGADIDDRIKWIVDDLAEMFIYVDINEVMKNFGRSTKTDDPIIHFYETFLSEYNPKLRKSRGVWYTPEPVVKFIVKAVDDILKTEFNLQNGIADTSKITIKTQDAGQKAEKREVHRVQILDPAAGTGTFLAEVIKQIHNKNKDMQGMWNNYVSQHLLPRVYGFELLMASYAMAHLKLDLILKETGYTPQNNNRLKVYLTNSLEEAHPDTNTLFATWLADEAKEADAVKKDMPIMVVLGNPPYSGESANKGNWIMHLMEAYKQEPSGGKLKEKNPKWINDDYVKFIRYAEQFIEKNNNGIIGYITNHGFIDNPTFRGMRYHLLNTFDKIYIIDLHGNAKKKETAPNGTKDENVFDIQQGVSINLFIKTGNKRKGALAEVYHTDLYGKREYKYEILSDNTISSLDFKKLEYKEPFYFFVPKNFTTLNKYDKGFSVNDLFELSSVGIVTARDSLAIQYTKQEMKAVLTDFANLETEAAREKYSLGKDARDWTVHGAQQDLKNTGLDENKIQPISYRPFDTRYTYYTGNSKGFQCMARARAMRNIVGRDNIVLIAKRGFPNQTAPAFLSKYISDFRSWSSAGMQGGDYVFPLYTYDDIVNARQPNFNQSIINKFAQGLALGFVPEKTGKAGTFAPIDVLDYIYAVLHSPKYRETYKEFLKIDFPKIPYPKDAEKFWKLVSLGAELRKVHLLETDKLQTLKIAYPAGGNNLVEKVKYENKKVYINDAQYFDNVPETEWNFFIGGYQPAQRWLKDRKGRTLNVDDVNHYQKIINALYLTNSLMQKIDKIVIG
jgi:predicted helicase